MRLSSRVAFLAGMGGLLDGYDLIVISAGLTLIVKSFAITSPQTKGLLVGTAFLGGFLGAVLLSRLVDVYGRKLIFIYDLLLFLGGTLISALAVSVVMLFIGRFLTGLAIGVDLAVSWTLVAEFSPKERRGFLLSLQFILWGIGAAASFLVMAALLPLGNGAWRVAFLIGLVPAVVVIVVRRSLPESPRWLASRGQIESARQVIAQSDTGMSVEALETLNAEGRQRHWATLFRGRLLRLTAGVFIAAFLAFFLVAPVNLYTPEILKTVGLTGSLALSLLGSSFVWIFNILGFVAGGLLMDRGGRKPVGIAAFGLLGLVLLALTLFPVAPGVFFVLWVAVEFLSAFGAAVIWSWSSELFPTSVRGFAMGINSSANRLSGFVSSYIVAIILAESLKLLYIAGICAAIVIVFIVTVVINVESKGKDLEEISESPFTSSVET